MVDHELGEPLAVDRHDAPVPPTFRPGACLPGGASGGDEHPLVDAVAEECAGEGLQLLAADAVVLAVALGPEVDGIEAEGVLVDHAVDAAVAAAPDPHAAAAGAVAHGEQQLHHELLEGRRREGAEAGEQLRCQLPAELCRCPVDHLFRIIGDVGFAGVAGEDLPTAIRDGMDATFDPPHRALLFEATEHPADPPDGRPPQVHGRRVVRPGAGIGEDDLDDLVPRDPALACGENTQDRNHGLLPFGNGHAHGSAVAKGHG